MRPSEGIEFFRLPPRQPMQPDHGVLASQVSQYFQQGRWEELERLYRDALKEDEADARSAFRLGNLLAYQGRYREALVCFETAWLHKWPGPIALNNKGVVLSCLGETRAAFRSLWDASKLTEGCRPANYNLGILCEKLGNEGSLPAVILDLGLGVPGKKASEIAQEFFKQALDGKGPPGVWVWTETGPLDRPLFLWVEDLRSGFGFEPIREIVNVEQAYVYYEEGLALLEEGRWQDGISKLEASADLHSTFAERIKAPRTEALVRIVRSRFSELDDQWDSENFDAAVQSYDELLQLAPMLPDRAFADEILNAAINNLAQQIRRHKPAEGWEVLQRLITAARQRVEDDLQILETEGPEDADEEVPGLEKTPEPQSMRESAAEESEEGQKETTNKEKTSKQPGRKRRIREGPAAEYIRTVCRQAWGKQISYLLGQSDFETAIDLLEFPDIEWFADQDLPRWRRRVYTSQAQYLRTKGQSHRRRHKWKEAATCWKEGREAALLAEDDHVVESFDQLIPELLESAPAEIQDELRALLRDRDDREALRRCVEELGLRPGDARLTAQRRALIKQLLSQIRDALEAQQWKAAREIADAVLEAVPEEPTARRLFRKAEQKLIEQWAEEGKELLEREQIEEAETLCVEIEKLDPDHAGAREIRRGIEVLRRRAGDGSSPFDEAYYAYIEARDDGDPEKALDHALEMKKLEPRDVHTKEALDWVPPAFVHALRVQLEKDRTPETANILKEKLKRLFSLSPKYGPARELDKELRQVAKGYDNAKRENSYKKLGEAEDALLAGDAEKALMDLSAVRDPDLADEIQERRKEALSLLRERYEELLSEEKQGEADNLRKLLQRWDPSYIETRQREKDRKKEIKSEEAKLDEQVNELWAILGKNGGKSFDALKKIDRRVRTLDLEGSQIWTRRRRKIEEIRQHAKRNMSRWQRFKAKLLFDRYYSTELPEPPVTEEREENR
jgi:tetratricopeptide (TPR) repeat protein